jgi:hypothetical protein
VISNQGATEFAVAVVAAFFAIDQEVGVTMDKLELVASNARERLERGTCCPTAVRTVAVSRVFKLISHLVLDRTAETSSQELT